jgi:hypothetical protein
VSFQASEYTADVDALGTLRLLEAIRFLALPSTPRRRTGSPARVSLRDTFVYRRTETGA